MSYKVKSESSLAKGRKLAVVSNKYFEKVNTIMKQNWVKIIFFKDKPF